MANTYNIYRFNLSKLQFLIDKAKSVGMVKQKEKNTKGYKMEFYFSQELAGNEIWWWETYKDFFKDEVDEPKNLFHFGLLVCTKEGTDDFGFAITLGKSHFYVNKFIERDFGIKLAVRIASEDTLMLKKSTYYSGSKKQDISSYKDFIKDSYEPGESVDHLKLKATDKELWGGKNIIFADSIQLDIEKGPEDLAEVFNRISSAMNDDEHIRLPKRELVTDEDEIRNLDDILFNSIKQNNVSLRVEEFQVYGVNFSFSFTEYDYIISIKEGRKYVSKVNLGNTLDVAIISGYVNDHPELVSLEEIYISFSIEDKGSKFVKPLKELLDIHIYKDGLNYFLSNGDWCFFNQPFLDYLKTSLNGIDFKVCEPLDENDYQDWLAKKTADIKSGANVENKLLYREYYFNDKQSKENGFELLDRQLEQINSIEVGKRKYKLEIADLYSNEEIISVKISSKDKELIYNIEQSKDSLELIFRKTVEFDKEIKSVALWFVFDQLIERITEKNSIQFLLALQSWKKLVAEHGKTPKIYYSMHINKTDKESDEDLEK